MYYGNYGLVRPGTEPTSGTEQAQLDARRARLRDAVRSFKGQQNAVERAALATEVQTQSGEEFVPSSLEDEPGYDSGTVMGFKPMHVAIGLGGLAVFGIGAYLLLR